MADSAVKRASLPEGMRIYAVGDIHGSLDLLDRLQERIVADLASRPAENPIIIYLGDFIDRGEASRQVLDRLLHPGNDLPQARHLRGNHEQMLLDCLSEPGRSASWRANGGGECLLSYGVEPLLLRGYADSAEIIERFSELLPQEHLEFLTQLPLSFVAGDFFFCHAGVRPGVDLARQSARDLLWIRDEFLSSRADFGKVVVHGHTPVPQPELLPNRINVDTGACFAGRLTAAVIEGRDVRFIST
jgi:serine/threonine protein phosphatase 1